MQLSNLSINQNFLILRCCSIRRVLCTNQSYAALRSGPSSHVTPPLQSWALHVEIGTRCRCQC